MPLRCSVFIATSLDGFIAREDGSIDWLIAAQSSVPEGENCGYAEFMAGIDVLVMGRNTYEQVLDFDPWPYEELPVVVMSSRPIDTRGRSSVRASGSSADGLAMELAALGYRRAYVDGGRTVASFLAAGLIDDLTITTIPVLLGRGRPLFAGISSDIPLDLGSSRWWPFGFVQNTYRVRR